MNSLKKFWILLLLTGTVSVQGQEKVSLKQCIEAAMEHQLYLQQQQNIMESAQLGDAVIAKDWLPTMNVNVSATIQNEQIEFPSALPGLTVPEVPLDFYRALFVVNQQIYDAGITTLRRRMESLNYSKEQMALEQERFGLKSRIGGLYFGVLLTRENQSIVANQLEVVREQLKQLEGAAEAGAILKSQVLTLRAELKGMTQLADELYYAEKSLRDQLGKLTGTSYGTDLVFDKPSFEVDLADEAVGLRPEMLMLDNRMEFLGEAQKLEGRKLIPMLGFQGNAGYGNPGYNFFEEGWQPMLYAGVSLKWNVWDWGKTKKRKQELGLKKEILAMQQQRVEMNFRSELARLRNDILKNRSFVESDAEIVALRDEVVERAAAQMNNGVMTATEYLQELNKSKDAQMQMAVHGLQMELQQMNYLLVQGKY